MNNSEIRELQQNRVCITEVLLCLAEGHLRMQWQVSCDNCLYVMIFENVSRINIENLSYPMEIEGLEIICNRQNGWDRDSRYFIHDYEEQRINFYCQKYEISKLKRE